MQAALVTLAENINGTDWAAAIVVVSSERVKLLIVVNHHCSPTYVNIEQAALLPHKLLGISYIIVVDIDAVDQLFIRQAVIELTNGRKSRFV